MLPERRSLRQRAKIDARERPVGLGLGIKAFVLLLVDLLFPEIEAVFGGYTAFIGVDKKAGARRGDAAIILNGEPLVAHAEFDTEILAFEQRHRLGMDRQHP